MKIRHISPKIVITLLYYGRNVKTETIQKLVYQFNQFTLDTALYCLDVSGNRISIEPQVFDLLVYLIENRDRVVTRDEALENLWKDKVVTDSALGARIKEARKAVGDNGDRQGVIRTFHGRGYQFITEVTESSTQKASEKTEPLASQEVFSLPDKPSIAILPFTNMSGDPEQDYFSDGITEDIITELTRFHSLFVIARHSSFTFKGKSIDIKEVGHQLGVEYVVEGSVRKAGSRVRISAQLIEVETESHIWAERYDRELEDIFAVQDEVARAIVAVLPGRVEEAVAKRGQRKLTDNMKAYEIMLRGKMHWNRLSAEDIAEARRLFKKAVELDPRYARAYAHLSLTYLADALFGWATADFTQEVVESAKKAAALDSNDIFCESVLGYAYLVSGLWENTEKQFDKVIAQNVNDAEIMAWSGDALNMLGRHEEGRNLIVEAMRLDPLHPPLYDWFLGGVLYSEKRYEDVIQVLTGVALLNSIAYAWLAGAYAYLGHVEEARRALDTFIKERHRELSTANILVEADTIHTLAEAYRNHYRLVADWKNVFDGLRKAGLPE